LKYNLDKGEQITINGATSDIGLVLVTKGSVQVHWSDKDEGDPCYTVKNSWYGFISLLSTPMGTPFPKSVALENDTEIGILTRSAFYDLVLKHPDLLKTAAKKLLKELTPFLLKIFYFFDWTTVKSGSEIFNKGDPENGAFIVIRGRLKRPGHFAEHFDDFFLVGIYDVLLERNHTQSIIAARSTELCHVPSQIIRAIKNRFPTVQHKLVKVLGEQLLESWRSSNETQEEEKSSNQRRKLRVKAIAIFGSTWDAPVQKIISELKNSIAMISVSVIRLSSKRITERTPSNVGSNIDPLANPYLFAWLRDQERGYDILLYQCDSSLTNWTKWCLSEADVVLDLNLASKGPLVKIYENEVFQYAGRHAEIRLVLLHAPETVIPRGTADWLFR
jgi:CRP-like cAMP-binding protein